ncbi:MAG: rhodanese-like domain-containing protein [Proteobacteria bacterium]|nr:rhodanese-like domain-containing protein [Pseudomonadota bacterium]
MRILKMTLMFCCLMLIAVAASAADYNYISSADLKTKIEAQTPLHVLDIQVEEEFNAHHLSGALKTTAYPVKSDADRAKLEAILGTLQGDSAPIAIICPKGRGGAERSYDYLLGRGIDRSRLFILAGGQGGWPYPALLKQGS